MNTHLSARDWTTISVKAPSPQRALDRVEKEIARRGSSVRAVRVL